MTTWVEVERTDGRHVVRFGHGLLRAQLVGSGPDRCRVGLLATTALLLGGDVVELDVRVGPGAHLDLFDVAGTVAYHGRGRPAGWHVRIALAAAARLTYAGEPLVVSDGADVTRTLDVDLAAGATAALRDTVVLGRAGEGGGHLRSTTAVRQDGAQVLLEDQRLLPGPLRDAPGMLGGRRVVDTVVRLGRTAPEAGTAAVTAAVTAVAASPAEPPGGAVTYALLDGAGVLVRWLGRGLADSPLHALDLRAPTPRPALVAPRAAL